jgi:hypothetical protein
MKIALVTGGLPRFTFDFVNLMQRLKGFDSADIYMTLWSSDWARSEEEARIKIEKVLLPQYKLVKIKIVDEPDYELPPHSMTLSPPTDGKYITWWYKRLYLGSLGLAWAHDLIDKEYDVVVTFRLDASPDRDLDLSQYDFSNNQLVSSKNGHSGFPDFKVNDQLVFGSQASVKLYCDMGKHIKELVPLSDPNWAKTDIIDGYTWTWGREFLIGYYMKKNNIPWVHGDFEVTMNTFGRSRFTDKHYHHSIAQDPTET